MNEVFNGRYGVNVEGVIYSLRANGQRRKQPMPMKLRKSREGYLWLTIYQDTRQGIERKTYFAHRLVALAYLPNPFNLPQVNHKDGVKTNNHPDNLEWVTASENMQHAHANGLTSHSYPWKGKFNENHNKSRAIQQLTLNGELIRVFPSAREAQRQGFSQGNIHSVIYGKRKSHKGYLWAYT